MYSLNKYFFHYFPSQEINFCKAEGAGPLSLTTGLVARCRALSVATWPQSLAGKLKPYFKPLQAEATWDHTQYNTLQDQHNKCWFYLSCFVWISHSGWLLNVHFSGIYTSRLEMENRETKKSLGVKFLMCTFTFQGPSKRCDDTSPQQPCPNGPSLFSGQLSSEKMHCLLWHLKFKSLQIPFENNYQRNRKKKYKRSACESEC